MKTNRTPRQIADALSEVQRRVLELRAAHKSPRGNERVSDRCLVSLGLVYSWRSVDPDGEQLTELGHEVLALLATSRATRQRPSGHARSRDGVVMAWKKGRPLSASHLWTDGETLYSYRLVIGYTIGKQKIAIDYRQRISCTTSMHCGAAIAVAHKTVPPEQAPKQITSLQ